MRQSTTSEEREARLDLKKYLTVIMMIRSGYVSKLVVFFVAEEYVSKLVVFFVAEEVV